MKGLRNNLAKGLVIGSLFFISSTGFSQEKFKFNFPQVYSSMVMSDRLEAPVLWRTFSREKLPCDSRLEVFSEYSNYSFNHTPNWKFQGTVQKYFPIKKFEPYLGIGVNYNSWNHNSSKFSPTIVGGFDVDLNKKFKLYLRVSQEFKQQPSLRFGLVARF